MSRFLESAAYNQAGLQLQLWVLIESALHASFAAHIAEVNGLRNLLRTWASEVRRLTQFHIPMFVRLAAVEHRVDKLDAVRHGCIRTGELADRTWVRALESAQSMSSIDTVGRKPIATGKNVELFDRIITACAKALERPAGQTAELPEYAYVVWNCATTALTHGFQSAIAHVNSALEAESAWWRESVCTHTDVILTTWLEIVGHRPWVEEAVEAGIGSVDYEHAWEFACAETAKMLVSSTDSLKLPDRAEQQEIVFAAVRSVVHNPGKGDRESR